MSDDLALQLLAILFVLGALAGLLLTAACRPRAFLALLTLSAFVSRVALPIGAFDLRVETVLGLVAAATLLLRARERNWTNVGATVWGLLLAWVSVMTVSTVLFSGNTISSLAIVAWLLTDLAVALYVVRHRKHWRIIVSTAVWASAACIVFGTTLWLLATAGGPNLLVHPDRTYGGYAVYLLAHEANILAGTVVLFAAACLTRFTNHLPYRLRAFVVLGTPALALATHTRTAVVALAAAAIAAGISQRQFKKTFVASTAATALVVLLSLTSSLLPNLSKFGQLGDFQSGTGAYRLNAINTAFEDLKTSPIAAVFGHGANTFGINHLDPSLPAQAVPWYLPNLPTQILYDSGLIGFALVGGAFLLMMKRRVKGADPLIVAAFVTSLTTSQLWLVQSWLLVGLALAASWRNPTSDQTSGQLVLDRRSNRGDDSITDPVTDTVSTVRRGALERTVT